MIHIIFLPAIHPVARLPIPALRRIVTRVIEKPLTGDPKGSMSRWMKNTSTNIKAKPIKTKYIKECVTSFGL